MRQTHTFSQPVTFGDCDPAGILFYPNIFRWLDAAFHDWLRPLGGHAALCERLGAVGLGLIDVSARFRSPIRDGDRVVLRLSVENWAKRSVRLAYEGRVADRLAVEAKEVRGVFKKTQDGLVAADLSEFRDILGELPHG
jgi:4-hydroxybenzoyl-CoA thioesterase